MCSKQSVIPKSSLWRLGYQAPNAKDTVAVSSTLCLCEGRPHARWEEYHDMQSITIGTNISIIQDTLTDQTGHTD